MLFVNHTPFPALAFAGIDQHSQAFHVIALRQTLSFASGQLQYADEQAPLCEADEFFGEINASSVRQESDLCQYKPHCDVIVNATAYAPQGKPARRFVASLRLQTPTVPMPLPEAPQGLSPMQSPSHAQMEAWRTATELAKQSEYPSQTLLHKQLNITGERNFKKWIWPLPLVTTLLKWGSLGLIQFNPWRLTSPKRCTELPLRYEFAYGGNNRVNRGDKKVARRLGRFNRMSKAQQAAHSDQHLPADQQAIAHHVWERNMVGRGFAQSAYVRAAGLRKIPAPRIEPLHAPITARLFWRAQRGQFVRAKRLPKALELAGFGVRSKVHPERRSLAGTIDDTFIKGDAWLPEDFDFAMWNAAPADQQIAYLKGDEIIELSNLCQPDTLGCLINEKGDTVLTLSLPSQTCFNLVRMANGAMFKHDMHIDTLIIEPDTQTVTLVWRSIFPKDTANPIRACEARMMHSTPDTNINNINTQISADSSQASATGLIGAAA